MRWLNTVLCLAAALGGPSGGLRGQGALPVETAPFSPMPSPAAAGDRAERMNQARLAHDLGVVSEAVRIYAAELALGQLGPAERVDVTLKLVDALLDRGDIAPALERLNQIPADQRSSAWALRAGLVATHQRWTNPGASGVWIDAAKSNAQLVREGELPVSDRPWLPYLQGLIADAEGDSGRAQGLYEQAIGRAAVGVQRDRFLLERELSRLRSGVEGDVQALRANAMQLRGTENGYDFVRLYVIAESRLGAPQRLTALEFLRQSIAEVPQDRLVWRDRLRLLFGLVAGPETEEGWLPLRQVVTDGVDPVLQRAALQVLARHAGVRRPELRRLLDEQIQRTPATAIRDDLLALRAQMRLLDRTNDSYTQAASDASQLLQEFPASPWRMHAQLVLASAAWAQENYRRAADVAVKLREEMPAGPDRARLGLLAAEAYFRGRDFRNAASAYDLSLREAPAGISVGELVFQRVQAEIAASDFRQDGSEVVVGTLIDTLTRDHPEFDLINRWKAEWNLARALMAERQESLALPRVERLLAAVDGGAGGIPAALRVRMEWLRARLTLAVGRPEAALTLVRALQGSVTGPGVDESTRIEIRSQVALIEAQASFDLQREEEGGRILDALRRDFPRSEAAAYSMLVQADYYKNRNGSGDGARAIALLNQMAETYPDSSHAPWALFQSALLERDLGQVANLNTAQNRLESLVRRYESNELVPMARLLQGDILRELNEYPLAEQAYREVVAMPGLANRREGLLAELSLAAVHALQVRDGGNHFIQASESYQRVIDHAASTPGMRLEAGYGKGVLHSGDPEEAQRVWSAIALPYLDGNADRPRLESTGPYWLGRVLGALEDSYRGQGRVGDAERIQTLRRGLAAESNRGAPGRN